MIQRLIKLTFAATLAIGLGLLAGCQGKTAMDNYRQPNPRLLTLVDESEGGTYQVKPGQHFNVNLYSNPYSGYYWEYVQPKDPILEPVGTPTFIQLREDQFQPKYGMVNFEFVAKEMGKQQLKFVYHRPTLRSRQDELYLIINIEVVDLPITQPMGFGRPAFVVPPKGMSVEEYLKEQGSQIPADEADTKPATNGSTSQPGTETQPDAATTTPASSSQKIPGRETTPAPAASSARATAQAINAKPTPIEAGYQAVD